MKYIIGTIRRFIQQFPYAWQFYIKSTLFRNPAEHLFKSLQHIYSYNPPQTILQYDTILDVGAYNGATINFWHKHFPHHLIIAFEPNEEMINEIKKNTKHIPLHQFHLYPIALSDQNTTTHLNITKNKPSASLHEISSSDTLFNIQTTKTIMAKTLDSISEIQNKKILILKLDVQGHELSVLKGSKYTLTRTKWVLTEMSNHTIYKSGSQYYEVDAFLRQNGFQLIDIIPSLWGYDLQNYTKENYHKYQLLEYDALYFNPNFV